MFKATPSNSLTNNIFGIWYSLSLFEGSTRYQMIPENFFNFFKPKNKVFGLVQVPEKRLFTLL
jgi:hypothetical protein